MPEQQTQAQPEAQPEAPPTVETAAGRIAVVDVLRGLAILWVITFHLWLDMTGGVAGANALYGRFGDRLRDADPLAALTAAGEAVLGSGYQGVSVFMMLSGFALTMHAMRNTAPLPLAGYVARFRRLLVPYWGGVAIYCATFASIAVLQAWADGGSVREQWSNVHIAVTHPIYLRWDDVLYALSVFGWIFRTDQVATPATGALWFVAVMAQYYLVFPLAMGLLRRIGPSAFAVAAIAVTIAARTWFAEWAPGSIEPQYWSRTLDGFGVFRCTEFFLGMSLGYLFAARRAETMAWVATPFDVAGVLVIAGLMQWASIAITPESTVVAAALIPLGHLSLAAFAVPLLFKAPGRLEASVPARALIVLGVVSFTALIVTESMRYYASFLRAHDTPEVLWWGFLVLVYVPGSTLIAYPLARLFGILPSRRDAAAPEQERAPSAPSLEPAAGG